MTYKDQELVSDVSCALSCIIVFFHRHSQALGGEILRPVRQRNVVLLTCDFPQSLLNDRQKDFLGSGFAEPERN